jgi:hypothetical protein
MEFEDIIYGGGNRAGAERQAILADIDLDGSSTGSQAEPDCQ